MGKILLAAILFIVFVVIYNFVARPFKITNFESFENYKGGDTIFAVNHDFIVSLRRFKKGDVIVLKNNVSEGEGIGTIVGLPGDSANGTYYLSSKVEVGDVVPSGFYIIKLPESSRRWVISEKDIKYLLWFPFIKLRQINTNVES